MSSDRSSFGRFELDDESYLQFLGTKDALCIEARIYKKSWGRSIFKHYAFAQSDLSGEIVRLGNSEYYLDVDSSEILTRKELKLIARSFLLNRSIETKFIARDVTSKYDR